MDRDLAVTILRRLGYLVEHVDGTVWRVAEPTSDGVHPAWIITIDRMLINMAEQLSEMHRLNRSCDHAEEP